MILNPPNLELSKIAGVEIKDYPKFCPCCGEAFESYTKRKKAITYANLKIRWSILLNTPAEALGLLYGCLLPI